MTLQKWSPQQKLVNGRQFAVRTERRLSARKSVRATVTRRAPHKPSPVPPPCSLGWQEVQLLQAPRWNTPTPTPNPPPPPARPLLPRGWRARAQCQREAVVDAQLVPRLSQLELLVLWSLQKPGNTHPTPSWWQLCLFKFGWKWSWSGQSCAPWECSGEGKRPKFWEGGAKGDPGEQERQKEGGGEAGAPDQEDQHCLVGNLPSMLLTRSNLTKCSISGWLSFPRLHHNRWLRGSKYTRVIFSSLQTNSTLTPILVKHFELRANHIWCT